MDLTFSLSELIVFTFILVLAAAVFYLYKNLKRGLDETSSTLYKMSQKFDKDTELKELKDKYDIERMANLEKSMKDILEIERLSGSEISSVKTTAQMLSKITSLAKEEIYKISNKQDIASKSYAKVIKDLDNITSVMIGSQSKGKMGENILESLFSGLPIDYYKKDFSIGGKVVEYGFNLPSGLVLPVDSKVFDTKMLSHLDNTDSQLEKDKALLGIRSSILKKAKEISTYLSSELTTSFAVMVVPDSIFDIAGSKVLHQIFQKGIILLKYSNVMPYLLSIYHLELRYNHNSQQAFEKDIIIGIAKTLEEAISIIEKRLAKSLTMAQNARLELVEILSAAKRHIKKLLDQKYKLDTQTTNSSSTLDTQTTSSFSTYKDQQTKTLLNAAFDNKNLPK